MSTKTPRRLVIGISGASGTIYGIRALELLKKTDIGKMKYKPWILTPHYHM